MNNVEPNKDLIADSAKYGGPVRINNGGKVNFEEKEVNSGIQAQNPNYRQKLDISGKVTTKVGGGGSILNTNVESSGWKSSLHETDYVKTRKRAEQKDLSNNQYRVKLTDSKQIKVGGSGFILNTNVESSGLTPCLQKNIDLLNKKEKIIRCYL